MRTARWNVDITCQVDPQYHTSSADAVLTAGADRLTGHGTTRKNPADPDLPVVGAETAVARALTDLAEQLRALADDEIATWTPPDGLIVVPDSTGLADPFVGEATLTEAGPPARLGPLAWLRSFPHAARLMVNRQIRLRRDRIGDELTMRDGRTYVPFRATVALTPRPGPATPTVLHPRFRLRGLGRPHSFRHQLFRRLCILTTPFFVGVDGFRSKLWMCDPVTGDYAGLYDWDDPRSARAYAEGLSAVLRVVSEPGSVGYELVPGQDVATYLAAASSDVSQPDRRVG